LRIGGWPLEEMLREMVVNKFKVHIQNIAAIMELRDPA
jgi:hypothetical protein